MCDPTVLALGAAAIKVAGQIGSASAQNANSAANKKAAIASQTGQINDINLRQMQEKQTSTQQLQIAQRQTTTAVSSAKLSAGEAGVSGASVDALLQSVQNEASANSENVKLNEKMTQDQLDRQKLGIYAQTQDRINSVPKASPLATGLKIGGTIIDTIGQLAGRNPPSDGETATPASTSFNSARVLQPTAVNSGFIPPSFKIRGARPVYGG